MQTTTSPWKHRLVCLSIATTGCLLVIVGCAAILVTYAFASMIPAEMVGWARCAMILRKMLLAPSVVVVLFGVVATGAGIATVGVSVRKAFGARPFTTRTLVWIGILTTALLGLAGLLAISM